MRGYFVRVGIDEAHEVRNSDIQISWAIRNLRPNWHVLLTATLFLSNVEDVAGLFSILRSDEEYLWGAKHLADIEIIRQNATAAEHSKAILSFNF